MFLKDSEKKDTLGVVKKDFLLISIFFGIKALTENYTKCFGAKWLHFNVVSWTFIIISEMLRCSCLSNHTLSSSEALLTCRGVLEQLKGLSSVCILSCLFKLPV